MVGIYDWEGAQGMTAPLMIHQHGCLVGELVPHSRMLTVWP